MRAVAASRRRSSEAGVARCRFGTSGDAWARCCRVRSRSTWPRRSSWVQAAQRGHGPAPGVVSAAAGSGDDVSGVVSSHRRRPPAHLGDGLKLGDHAVEVGGDLLVNLGDTDVAVVPGGRDQGEGALALLAQFGKELGASDEDRAGQAGVGVRALPLDWEPWEKRQYRALREWPPAAGLPAFTLITTPTPVQRRAFDLLGLSHRLGYL
jgi:hypothetical protein